jgi:hypothetical protein
MTRLGRMIPARPELRLGILGAHGLRAGAEEIRARRTPPPILACDRRSMPAAGLAPPKVSRAEDRPRRWASVPGAEIPPRGGSLPGISGPGAWSGAPRTSPAGVCPPTAAWAPRLGCPEIPPRGDLGPRVWAALPPQGPEIPPLYEGEDSPWWPVGAARPYVPTPRGGGE